MSKHRGFGFLACNVLACFLVSWSGDALAQVSGGVTSEAQPGTADLVQPPAASPAPASTPAPAAPPAIGPQPTQPPWRRGAAIQAGDSETASSAAASGGTQTQAGTNVRAQNSWLGSTGGLHVIDGSSGPVGTARMQLGFDYFSASDLLELGDHDQGLSGVLSLSATPIEQLEVFAALSSHSNSNTKGTPA